MNIYHLFGMLGALIVIGRALNSFKRGFFEEPIKGKWKVVLSQDYDKESTNFHSKLKEVTGLSLQEFSDKSKDLSSGSDEIAMIYGKWKLYQDAYDQIWILSEFIEE